MRVYFAGIDKGDYITSLKAILKKVNVDVIFDHTSFIEQWIPKGEIIHIHWPEAYFPKWDVNGHKYLKTYNKALQYYKDINPIIFTLHNLWPHDGKFNLKRQLYVATIQASSVLHHLGPESIGVVNKHYSVAKNKVHKIVAHHILPIPKEIPTKLTAKAHLSINKESKFIFCPGSIRHKEDIRHLWNEFGKFKNDPNVQLIVHKYRNLLNRYALHHLLEQPKTCYKEFINRILDRRVSFVNQYLSLKELCTYISASDLILLPRTQNLNSGIPFLTVNFKTPLIVHADGNILWSLEKLGYKKEGEFFKTNIIQKNQFNENVMNEMKNLYEMMV